MALASPPATPPTLSASAPPPETSFDIVSHYNKLISSDPSLCPSIGAIESLIALLQSSPLTTVSETLALLSHQCHILLRSQPNRIPLSAGTDLFQRYLVSSFQQRSISRRSDFATLRDSLIANSKIFVQRAKQASSKISQHALPFVRDDSTIITFNLSNQSSPIITSVLATAANANRYFSIIDLITFTSSNTSTTPLNNSTPTATIPLHALTYTLSSLPSPTLQQTLLILTASAVLENGAVISALGTHQIALIAKSFNLPVYIAVPSYTFVRSFPIGAGAGDLQRMGVRQNLLKFEPAVEMWDGDDEEKMSGKEEKDGQGKRIEKVEEMVEIVPPNLITALITENGVMTPEGVSEELIKLWL